MKIDEIVINSVIYPFLELEKFLILGILLLIGDFYNIPQLLGIHNMIVMVLLYIIGLLSIFLATGYTFRVLKFSLEGVSKPQEFNNWTEMFINGIKFCVMSFVYIIPALLILVLGQIAIAILYLIIIAPIIAMAIAYVAKNDSKFRCAFNFREIIDKIRIIGWGNLMKWYIANGIIFIILSFIYVPITLNLLKLHNNTGIILTVIFMSLIIAPFIYLYLSRSIGLFYISKEK